LLETAGACGAMGRTAADFERAHHTDAASGAEEGP
jgi:hypothetical protein